MADSLNEVSDNHFNSIEQPLSREALLAKAVTRPNLLAANTITHFNQVLGNVGLMEMAAELNEQISRVQNGDLGRAEETLAAQVIVLDTLFNTLAVKSLQAPGLDMQAVVLKLALQAQRQCCQTYETLSAIKNPPTVTVVRQTNIGQAVQVNNSATDENQKSHLENELLENTHGERLDIGAQITPIAVNQDLETMAKLDRSED
jgi:hypothetical protein